MWNKNLSHFAHGSWESRGWKPKNGWLHDVKVEKVLAPDPTFKNAVCLDGEKACPPEDCGGLGGYYDMLKSLADPKDPEHDDVTEWLGDEWDAARLDVDRVNAALKRMRA
ncbi:MAG: plasmid pRiA4b ORF-3 family protein [Opitutaceae bacterium]|nr:plasmid pRiA4b ORF-3 family protein [Opitutaceae bacterium]